MQAASHNHFSPTVPLNGYGSSASATGETRITAAVRVSNDGKEVSGGGHQLETQGSDIPIEDGDGHQADLPDEFAWWDASSSRSVEEESTDNNSESESESYDTFSSQGSTSPSAEETVDQEAPARSKKKTKAGLRLAAENMRGRGSAKIGGNTKWQKIANSLRTDKIGVLALMETHLTDSHVRDIHHLHKHLRVLNSPHPDNPTGAGGVAVVLNRHMTNADDAKMTVIIPGRVILVDLDWHRDAKLTLMAVYAPTDQKENATMWTKVRKALRRKRNAIRKPEVVLGDFNFVEDAIDRYPSRLNKIDNPSSFEDLKRWLRVVDGWRETNPGTVEWTWRNSARSSMSRIDRIYITRHLLQTSRQWDICTSELTTNDHSRILVEIAHLEMPDLGSGRWAMRENLTRDKTFLTEANDIARTAQVRLDAVKERGRSEEENPQTIWRDYKRELVVAAKRRARTLASKDKTKLEKIKADRESAKLSLRLAVLPEDVEKAEKEVKKAEQRFFEETDKKHCSIMEWRKARANEDAERMTRSWFSWSKDQKPRDTFFALRRPLTDPPNYATDSKTMVDIAREHHESMQMRDLEGDAEAREQATNRALDHIEARLTDNERAEIGRGVDRDAVVESLMFAKNGSAPGLDGVIYEFWKAMHRLYEKSVTVETFSRPWYNDPFDDVKWCDVAGMMAQVYDDIERHGLMSESTFAEGWMCPLYKKGDRTDIANYRPITLLNTDYKIYTKFLALKIAKIAPRIVHESQAGFVRGRSITDQTKLTSLILDYAEVTEENGAIVALDQEKAYDRVRHDYLPRVLKKYGFPDSTVRTMMSLYDNAWTSVMVNGHLSSPFRVTRGVRQGDPLSCLLFDLAIEPLSAMLRASELKGFQIEGLERKLIASLYADDTTVYLSEHDSYDTLMEILDSWCLASGAHFNVAKTEMIPLGTKAYRERLSQTAELKEGGPKVPANIRITRDGETTRILGAWPGNEVDHAQAWSVVLDKVSGIIERWEKARPTLNGRALVSQAIIGGCTQYLTAAQGMPEKVAKKLDALTLDFMWSGSKRHPVNMDTIRSPKIDGGLNAFCCVDRNDAQYLVWIGAYLEKGELRPLWCYLADVIFRARVIGKHEGRIRGDVEADPFTQNWRPNQQKVPFILRQMLRVANKYELSLSAPWIPQTLKEGMSIWAHPAMQETSVLDWKSKEFRCLKLHHAARTVEDLEELAEIDDPDHEPIRTCWCENCRADRAEGCRCPYKCQEAAEALLSEISVKWNPATPPAWELTSRGPDASPDPKADIQEGARVGFPRHTAAGMETLDLVRVGTTTLALPDEDGKSILDRYESQAGAGMVVSVNVVAAMTNGDSQDAKGGYAIRYSGDVFPEITASCPQTGVSYIATIARAITHMALKTPANVDLIVRSNCRTIVEAFSIRLARNEQRGWAAYKGDAQAMRIAAAALRARESTTSFTFVNKKRLADDDEMKNARLVAEAAVAYEPAIDFSIAQLKEFDFPGRAIRGMKQKDAHEFIRQMRLETRGARSRTRANIMLIQESLREAYDYVPTEKQIWMGLQSRDISRSARNFLWKAIHGAHKIGEYFDKMPQPWADYAACETCGVKETLDHILFECPDSGHETVWELVDVFLERKCAERPLNLGLVLGCASARFGTGWSARDPGAERAFRMIVSESAFMIWKFRCEKRIEHAGEADWRLTVPEIESRWWAMWRLKRSQDHLLLKRPGAGRASKRHARVWQTWRDLGNPKYGWPEAFINPGVLVGRERPVQGIG